MAQNQFSLRAIFIATAIVAVALALAIRWQFVVQVLPLVPFALLGACAGGVAGRLIGTDHIDAMIGAILGAIAGSVFSLLGPHVE